MHHDSVKVNGIVKNPLPSADNTSDSESDIIEALDQKRRQLDDEITQFRLTKDREFREFEKHIRIRRRSRTTTSIPCESSRNKQRSNSGSAASSLLGLLASNQPRSTYGSGCQTRKDGNGVGEKITKVGPISQPTLSLDRLSISGKTTAPYTVCGAPFVTQGLDKSMSASSTSSTTPPRSIPKPPQPPTPTERADSFAGVFTPAYLPLLESRNTSPRVQSPQALNAKEDGEKQAHLDTMLKQEAQKQSSHSLPQQPISPTLVTKARSRANPSISSTSLPSALRTPSDSSVRKRKRVTFQLADSAIVEPSSSYEETSSPDTRDGSDEDSATFTQNAGTTSEAEERQDDAKGPSTPTKEGEPERDRDQDQDQRKRLLSPAISPMPSPGPTAMTSGFFHRSPSSDDDSTIPGDLFAAEDGGSGVGFFELDEELGSPGFTEERGFDFAVEDAEEDLEDEKKGGLNVDVDVDDDVDEKFTVGSFAAGSVPIDIVRPTISGSWIGSFGH